jgi:FADH2 O2-dependent halogenase
VTMDERLYPKRKDLSPEEEFFELANRFPAVARQFDGAVTAREWVSTERLQYSSTASIGERWCLMSHAAGFIDPLFSRGISNTAYVINALAWRLLAALRDNVFSLERFEYVQRLEQGLLDYNDGMVNASFISFEHYHFWSAVFRIWAFGSGVAERRLLGALIKYRRTGDEGVLHALEDGPNVGLMWPDHDGFKQIFDAVVANADLVERGEISGDDAGRHLFGMLKAADFVPSPLGFDDPEARFIRPTPRVMASFSKWLVTKAPPEVRQAYSSPTVEAVKTLSRGRRP